MKKKKISVVSKIYFGLIFFFLYMPIGIMIFMSFNSGRNSTVWKGFSFKWYGELFKSKELMNALGNTLIIALLASVFATILGTAAAIGIRNFKGRSRAVIQNVSNLPIISPDIVMGVSLMLLFSFLGVLFHFEMGFWTVLISHICFCVPFVVLNVMPRLRRMDLIHELMPGIFSGMLISFTYSMDDVVITHFTQGASFNNLSTKIFEMLRRQVRPTVNALSALLFAAIIIVLVLINIFDRRAEKRESKRVG